MWRHGLRAIVLLLVVAPAGQAQLAGRCYDSSFEPWEPIEGTHTLDAEPPAPPSAEHDTRLFPPRLLFGVEPVQRAPDWNRVEIPEGALPLPRPFRSWRLEGDTLRIGLTDGFSGVRGWFVERDGGWQGSIETVTDHGGSQRFRRSAALEEAACDSPPPVPASADPPAPRSVLAIGGPPLEVGRRVPEPYGIDPDPRVGNGGWLMGFEPGGYWSGAERFLVFLDADAIVWRIEVRYPEGFDASQVARGLVQDFGTGVPDAPWLSWSNHSTRAFLQESGAPRAVLMDTTLGR